VVLRGLSKEPADRFDSAMEMAEAIERATTVATARSIGQWVSDLAGPILAARARLIESIESSTAGRAAASRLPAPPAISAAPTIPDTREAPHTSVSVASDRERVPPPSKRWSWAWVALGGAVMGGAVATAFLLGRAQPRETALPSTMGTPAAIAAPPPPDSSPAQEPAPGTIVPLTSAVPASPTTSAASHAPARRPARPKPVPSPPPAPSGLYTRE
jgi:serine/threonine-protein kinase